MKNKIPVNLRYGISWILLRLYCDEFWVEIFSAEERVPINIHLKNVYDLKVV